MLTTIEYKPGYIYLLRSHLFNGYKIGISTAMQSRMKALGVGVKTDLLGYWEHAAYRELEKHFHKLFNDVRVPQTEYFLLDDTQLQTVVDQLNACATPTFLDPTTFPNKPSGDHVVRFTKTPPYAANKYANWYYFGWMVMVAVASYFIGTLLSNGY